MKNMKRMKRVAKAIGTLGLAGCAVISSPSAMADDAFWYIGGNVGQSKAKIDDDRIRAQLPGSVSISDDRTDPGYKLFGGYQLNKNFALEAGYFHLGEFGYTATTAPAGSLTGSIKVQGVNLDLVGIIPINDKFSVFGRLGAQYAEAKDQFSSSGVVNVPADPNPNFKRGSYKFGAGAQYDFTQSLGMRLEAERYRIDDAVGNKGDIDLVSVGLVYRFDQKKPAPKAAPARVVAAAPVFVVVPVVKKQQYCSILDLSFEIKQENVDRGDKEKLAVVGTFMNKYPDTTAVIEGHTDSVGTSEYNQKLSQERADSVVKYLVDELHVAPSRLSAVGYGETRPIADNSTEEGKQANRRIEAVIACATDVAGLKVQPARVTMSMEVEFDPLKSTIEPKYLDGLRQVADFMKANPAVTGVVEGHASKYSGEGADKIKTDPAFAMQVSQSRAQNVVNYLVDQGVSRSRLATAAYGEMGRVSYGTTLEGQQENRRVNIILNYPKR